MYSTLGSWEAILVYIYPTLGSQGGYPGGIYYPMYHGGTLLPTMLGTTHHPRYTPDPPVHAALLLPDQWGRPTGARADSCRTDC